MKEMRPVVIIIALILSTGCALIDKARKEIPTPDPVVVVSNVVTDVVVPDPAPTNTTTINEPSVPCSSIPVTAQLSNVQFGKSKITWSMTGTQSWPKKSVKVDVQGMTFLYVWRDGKWTGGKFDWFRPNQSQKGLENIHGNYMGIIPVKGDRVAFGLLDINKSQRSNFIEGIWL